MKTRKQFYPTMSTWIGSNSLIFSHSAQSTNTEKLQKKDTSTTSCYPSHCRSPLCRLKTALPYTAQPNIIDTTGNMQHMIFNCFYFYLFFSFKPCFYYIVFEIFLIKENLSFISGIDMRNKWKIQVLEAWCCWKAIM